MKITIDHEFRSQIPPASPEELAELESDILEHGIRDPLVIWAGQRILLDGHNRYEISQRHRLTFQTVEYEFPDRTAAADFIDRNQLGRRNLTPDQMSLIRGRRYERLKGKPGQIVPRGRCEKDIVPGPNATARILGREHGVGQSTIGKDAQFARAVETLKPILPDLEQKIIRGEGPSRKLVKEAAEVSKTDPEKARAMIEAPKPKKQPPERKPKPRLLAEDLRGRAENVDRAVTVLCHLDPAEVGDGQVITEVIEQLSGCLKSLRSFIQKCKEVENAA